jgi:hypothetical protein
MDGYDLLVLEFLALVICVTVLIVISCKFKPLVIITSAYPNFGHTVTAFGHRAPERTYPFICSGIKVRLELEQEIKAGIKVRIASRDECRLVSRDDLEA